MGHPVAGSLTSPVADLGDPDGAGRIAPVMDIRSCRLEARRTAPSGTAVLFEMRSGSTPAFDPKSWSAWRATARLEPAGTLRAMARDAVEPAARRDAGRLARHAEAGHPGRAAGGGRLPDRALGPPGVGAQFLRLPVDGAEPARAAPGPAIPPGGSDRARQDRSRTPLPPARLVLETVVRLAGTAITRSARPGTRSKSSTRSRTTGASACARTGRRSTPPAPARWATTRACVVIDHHCLNEVWVDELGKWILMDCAGDNNFTLGARRPAAQRAGGPRGRPPRARRANSRSASGGRPGSRGFPTPSAARSRSSAPASTSASRWKAR